MKKMTSLSGKREKFYSSVFEAFGRYKVYHFPSKEVVINVGNRLIRVNTYKAEKTPRNRRSSLQDIAVAITAIFWASLFETNSDIIHRFNFK